MEVTILVDNKDSWFVPYAKELCSLLCQNGAETKLIYNQNDAKPSDICFLLSCSRLVKKKFLDQNRHNIVVHASDLPKGKGFSPLQWQILEGKNEIVLTLFEVVEDVDAGPYYMKEKLVFAGTELLHTLHDKMAKKIIEMCFSYAMNPEEYSPKEQQGESTFYSKRVEKDDELDVDQTIREQFNHLRIADNENHPVWFRIGGKKYCIKIYEDQMEDTI